MRRGLCTLYDQSPSALRFGNPVACDLHVVIGRTLAGSTRAVQSCLCSLRHINVARGFLQHLARACSEQSRSTTVLPINHVIQMPQCLSGFVNHDYCTLLNWNQWSVYHVYRYLRLIWLVTIKPILVWNWIDECHFPCYYIKRYMSLTHWGRDKMDPITQTTFSRAFSWMNMFEFRLKFHWGLFPRVQLTIFQHWFR